MFGFFKKDPIAKLQKEYERLLEKARDTQRKGDIKGYAALMEKAEEMLNKIEQMKQGNK
ncbi:MAG: Lacal_2735 family protein [Bacteroidetes bacterium]|nr:MAG: Lacal_2735 family protein [Bacteroidota bacterium]